VVEICLVVESGKEQMAKSRWRRVQTSWLATFYFLLSAFCLSLLLSTFSITLAQSCKEQLPGANEYSRPDVDIKIYFRGFTTEDVQTGPFNLTQGVCIENTNGFQLLTIDATVTIIDDSPNIEAKDVELSVEGYELTAATLVSNAEGLQLTGVTFSGTNLGGMAATANYTYDTQEIELLDSSVRGQSLTIKSKRAMLIGDRATFENLTATTCTCKENPLYIVRAERANFNLTTQTLNINTGTLELAGLRLAFDDVTVSPQTLQDFRFPVTIEYVPGAISDGATGLGVRVPSLRLGDTLTLELGLVGLDVDYPLGGIFVIHYKNQQATADIGLTPYGFQADVRVTEPLAPWLDLNFGVNNREWGKADFLHEGYLSAEARTAFSLLPGDSLSLNGQLLTAASSQTLETVPVVDGRLGVNMNTTYRAPPLPLGQLELTTQTWLSYYPVANITQWGVRLAPRWQHVIGAFSVDVSYSRLWTNSVSPFSTKLDKLEPESRIVTNTKIAGPLASNLQGELNFSVNYNFLDVERYTGEGFASLATSGKLSYQVNDLTVVPSFSLELAPLMNPDLDKNFRPLLGGGLTIIHPRWEAGFGASYDLGLEQLSKLETKGSFTIDLGDVSLEPFLALNILPTLTDSTWPRLSGHGLEVAWRTCCGDFHVGYRQYDGKFTTTLFVVLGE
jgi:hypothetical protein